MSITKKPAPQLVDTDIVLVLDDSGSMQGIADSTLRETNSFIRNMKRDFADVFQKTGSRTFFSLILFGRTVSVVESRVPIEKVTEIATYHPTQGATALIGGVNTALDLVERGPNAYLIAVITDGGENVEYGELARNAVKERIRRAQATDRCTLSFQVPRRHTDTVVHLFGVPRGNVMEWDQDDRGVEVASQVRSASTTSYAQSRAAGKTSTDKFYATTDLSKVTKTKLKRELTDVSSGCKVWTVDKDTRIDEFCARKSKADHLNGAGFYQLYKQEKVQPYKKIMIKPKDSESIYTGDEARELIGIPVGQTVNLKPGNQGNYDVFIQSTAPNRKLPKGTQVVYCPAAKTDLATWTAQAKQGAAVS